MKLVSSKFESMRNREWTTKTLSKWALTYLYFDWFDKQTDRFIVKSLLLSKWAPRLLL
ncbi:MAG: hypothetical protein ACTS6H_00720 [Candidatus Hodgkinia cicadicola]